MERVITGMVILLIIARGSESFFDYTVDCDSKCQKRTLPCTISEFSPTHFLCECIISDDACVERSSPVVVCLRPGGLEPRGGSEIWVPYWNYTHPKPTHRPTPSSDSKDKLLEIYAALVTAVLVLQWGFSAVRCIMASLRRHHYERLEASTAPSDGTPDSRPNPYRETTTVAI